MSPGGHDPVALTRDCPALMIPSGEPVLLRRGDEVLVVQTLGGSFTVQTDRGMLVRVDAGGADALGLDAADAAGGDGNASAADGPGADGPFDLEQVMDQLRTVFDPEIPVNVVELGLVYGCEAVDAPGGRRRIEIKMSMTAPGCGMGDVLREDARLRVEQLPGVDEVDVEIVWDPPWDIGRMSEAARLQLGLW